MAQVIPKLSHHAHVHNRLSVHVYVMFRMNHTRQFKSYEPHATPSSEFFGDLDERDISLAIAIRLIMPARGDNRQQMKSNRSTRQKQSLSGDTSNGSDPWNLV